MRIGPNEAALLDAFARAASKAQGIEAILQDSVAGIEVVQDTRSRPFPDIEKKIDKLPLGPLLNRFIKTVAKDMNYSDVFERLWYDINQERIFLMHKFFRQFPIAKLEGNEEAARRLERIDDFRCAAIWSAVIWRTKRNQQRNRLYQVLQPLRQCCYPRLR